LKVFYAKQILSDNSIPKIFFLEFIYNATHTQIMVMAKMTTTKGQFGLLTCNEMPMVTIDCRKK